MLKTILELPLQVATLIKTLVTIGLLVLIGLLIYTYKPVNEVAAPIVEQTIAKSDDAKNMMRKVGLIKPKKPFYKKAAAAFGKGTFEGIKYVLKRLVDALIVPFALIGFAFFAYFFWFIRKR